MRPHRLPIALPPLLALLPLVGAAAGAQDVSVNPQDAALHSQLERLNDNIERIATLLERSLEGQQLEQYTRELGLQLQLLKERLRNADRKIVDLENEVMAQRASIRDWQDFLDEELTSRR